MAKYRAVAFKQTTESREVVLFAAPATDIGRWAGIPQRELLDNRETIGFQRDENPKRIRQLQQFFEDTRNVVQNPLLCASRDKRAYFSADDGPTGMVRPGWVTIEEEDLSGTPIQELLNRLENQLRSRGSNLFDIKPDPSRLQALQNRLGEAPATIMADDDGDIVEQEDDSVNGLFSNETHLLEFLQEVICRRALLEQLNSDSAQAHHDEFLGFTRDAIESYLRPVFLVDGQHRLRGALQAAEWDADKAAQSDEVYERVASGEDIDQITKQLQEQHARILPVSLLMEENVEEHVFQFVVVNQKATPVGTALLGTIVATSLSEGELGQVADRLEQVGINVIDSQAVAWFTRSPESPFHSLVQQGIGGESGDKLPWTVLRDLVSKFRNLKGGQLWHSPKIDYADKWRRTRLSESGLVAEAATPESQKETWSSLEGPWRNVCAAFFWGIRDELGNAGNPDAPNSWGSTRSNLYNKISLSILVADFFQYLTDKDLTINSPEHCRELVNRWLGSVDRNYFAKSWNLSGIKKDTPGIRAQWSELWVDYRKDPQRLPDVRNFRKPKQVSV
jgi:hypothetical protein